jgi:LuxR family maltose regulon positive regulatory protein
MQYALQLSLFIWFDSFIGDYRIHPLYLEFLQTRQSILSEKETQNTYRQAAEWSVNNEFYTDAVNYYAKSHQYDRILDVLLSHPFKLPHDTCEYYLSVLNEIDPDNNEKSDRSILFLKNLFIPLLYIGIGKYEDAMESALENTRKWEHSDEPVSSYLLYTAYSNLAYIDTYMCTVTHNYNSPEYLKKALEYYEKSSIQPVRVTGAFSVVDVRSFACLVGEGAGLQEFDQFLETARETALFINKTYHNMYYGYDDLVACELAFFRNQLNLASNFAYSAVLKAREKKQYNIEAVAQYYLLRIAIHEGDHPLIKEILKQVSSHLDNPDFWNRQLLYDLIIGSLYTHIGLTDMVPSWIAVYEKETRSEVRIPVRELIVSAGYFLATKKYKQALAILCNSYPRIPQERFFFGELTLSLLLAYTRIKTDNAAGAIEEFEKAYLMSFNGEFEMPFIELGSTFHQLAVAALNNKDCVIPENWLKTIDRKAAIYAKKTSYIRNSIKREKRIKDVVSLTDRELDVLSDLYLGLSREEIAANRYLSINTVKKILQSIYNKLDANNNVDAIRIAIEKKLIK